MPTLKKRNKKRHSRKRSTGGWFGNQNSNKTFEQNNADWKTWNISDPITYPSYDETMYYYKQGFTNYGKLPEHALQSIPDPTITHQIQYEPYERQQGVQFESNYPQQIILPIENVLPFMESGIPNNPIIQRKLRMVQRRGQDLLNYFWTNDANILATATIPHSNCNSFATRNGSNEPNKTYMCILDKMCYVIDEKKTSKDSFNFTLSTPA